MILTAASMMCFQQNLPFVNLKQPPADMSPIHCIIEVHCCCPIVNFFFYNCIFDTLHYCCDLNINTLTKDDNVTDLCWFVNSQAW